LATLAAASLINDDSSMTRKHDSFRALSIVGGLVLLGALLWYGPWLYRVATERLMLYRTCVDWSRASETLGEWAQTQAGCLGQVSRRRR
jgi:hypothetical protein